jgi:hypothetical protein
MTLAVGEPGGSGLRRLRTLTAASSLAGIAVKAADMRLFWNGAR